MSSLSAASTPDDTDGGAGITSAPETRAAAARTSGAHQSGAGETGSDPSQPSTSVAAIKPPLRAWSKRILLGSLALSAILHLLGINGAADWLANLFRYDEPDPGPPLRAVLKPPPPPVFQQEASGVLPPKPKAKPRPARAPPPLLSAASVVEPVNEPGPVAPLAGVAAEAPPTLSAAEPVAVMPVVEAPAVVTPAPEPVTGAPPAQIAEALSKPDAASPPALRVPKRIDLVGTLFVGETNFMVGTGGFRLRHDGNRYEISVLGKAKGLARLILGGEFTGVSRGAITPGGLQPSEYTEERGRSDKRESALLDWEAGVIRLRDDKVLPIEPPLFDRLSVIMQFYYRPPEATELSMRVAGTRSVDTYTFKRLAGERLELPFATVDAHLWRANFDTGEPRIDIWMSPDYHYLPLRVRVHARKEFGGRYATLNIEEIRVED